MAPPAAARAMCGRSDSVGRSITTTAPNGRASSRARRTISGAFAALREEFGLWARVVSSSSAMPMNDDKLRELAELARRGGAPKYHEKNKEQGKLFARERIARLLDDGSFVEDGLLANAAAGDLAADGVVTGTGTIAGRIVAVMANDST